MDNTTDPRIDALLDRLEKDGKLAESAVKQRARSVWIDAGKGRSYALFTVAVAVLGGLVVGSQFLPTGAEGSILHILQRIIDAAIGALVMIMFIALALQFAPGLIAPNLAEANRAVERLAAAQGDDDPVSEAEARLMAGVFIRSGLIILSVSLGIICFGLWL